jgi:calpain-7
MLFAGQVQTSLSQSPTRNSRPSDHPPSYISLSIFASYDGPPEEVRFTVTVYSPCEMSWNETISKILYSDTVSPFGQNLLPSLTTLLQVYGALTSKNGGGNCSYPTFMMNPQYRFCIHPEKRKQSRSDGTRSYSKAQVVLVVQGSKDIPYNIMVVWSQGERVTE